MLKDQDKDIKLSHISILSAHNVDSNLLHDFYNIMFPESAKPCIWKWLNRSSFYEDKIPLVIIYGDRIIGHAGMIPFKVFLDERDYTASWFIDFAVLPELQGRGLGCLLTERWMDFSDIHLALCCNEKSMYVFKKHGWTQSFDTHLHHYYLAPFNHSKFDFIPLSLRKILNNTYRTFLYFLYRKYTFPDSLPLDVLSSDLFDRFKTPSIVSDNTVVPIRDSDYISWRLLNSPDRDKYRIFSIDDVNMVVKLYNKHRFKYIDLLWVSDSSNYSVIRQAISTLAIWGMNNDYSYIRYYTSSKELSNYLSKSLRPIVSQPMFAFYAKDITLFKKLKHSNWHWELIDSDFERF